MFLGQIKVQESEQFIFIVIYLLSSWSLFLLTQSEKKENGQEHEKKSATYLDTESIYK